MKHNRKIDFTIVGAQKASTTYLHHVLGRAPEIWMPANETPLFHGHHYAPGKVEDFVRQAEDGKMLGIKRPVYLYDCCIAQRLHDHNPGMKIIVVLRERISRCLSAYYHLMRYGYIPVRHPEEGLPIILEAAEANVAQVGHTVL
jgi:hypothetical protein